MKYAHFALKPLILIPASGEIDFENGAPTVGVESPSRKQTVTVSKCRM